MESPTAQTGTKICFNMKATPGTDNRESPLPLPIGRGEDALFGVALRASVKKSRFGHLPRAIFHSLMDGRPASPDDLRKEAADVGLCEIIAICMKSADLGLELLESQERYGALGKYLVQLGCLSPSEFDEFIRGQAARVKNAELGRMDIQLQSLHPESNLWRKEINQYLDTLRSALEKEDVMLPLDFGLRYSDLQKREITQQMISRLGELLFWWPEFVNAAKRLRKQGRKLARHI